MLGSNVIRRAQAEAAQATASTRRHVREEDAKKQSLDEGELVWIGEYKNRDMQPYKMTKGHKALMTDREQKLFHRTAYERGFAEHVYEGQLKIHTPKPDPKDPRSATREGQGIMWYPNGSMYEGTWKHDERHGHGYFSTNTGYKYTGEWVHDTFSGKGYESNAASVTYDGSFEAGNPHGVGVLLMNAQLSQYRYEGEFANGYRHGKGVIFYDNGDTFAGSFDMGRRHGRAITTTTSGGREIQYESEWDQDTLAKGPSIVPAVKRVKKPKPTLPFTNKGHLVAADLTKWTVKEDVTDLTLEHFMKIKLGFEKLDVHATGSLATPELAEIWGSGSTAMLEKLDTDGNGTVELDEIFAAWYPHVPPHNILRFMQQNISPKVLLRLRGILNTVRDEGSCGFLQICGVTEVAHAEDDPGLSQRQLEAAQYKIGGESFTLANYTAAKQLFDPPHFLEVLEVWYPNIPRSSLLRYEQTSIDPNELTAIKKDFYRLSRNNLQLQIEVFEAAQEAFQQRIAKANEEELQRRIRLEMSVASATNAAALPSGALSSKALPHGSSATTVAGAKAEGGDEDDTVSVANSQPLNKEAHDGSVSDDNPVEREMEEGFFMGQPEWRVGNYIRLSVALLRDVERFDTRLHGTVSIQQLLRYCYPNVTCRRMAEVLQPRKKGTGIPMGSSVGECRCQICTIV